MNERKFLNRYQPQTLVSGTMLCYVQAFFALISLAPILLIFALGLGFGGYGIANDKKWGYGLGVVMAFLPFALRVHYRGWSEILGRDLINTIFEIALVALLLHPQSRDYQRIWFK